MFLPCDFGWETSPCGLQSLPNLRDTKDLVAADESECLVEGEREQEALAPKDTIQNFQFCSVEERTYSSNILRMWSKRWRVMGTPVAGSCSWHRLWNTISVVGPCLGGWEPQKLSRSCQPMSLSQGMCGTWPYSILPLEHQPSHREG